MRGKKNISKPDLANEDKAKLRLLANQKPVTLLTDQDLEITAEKYGLEFEGGLKEARLLSIIHALEKNKH